MDSKIYLHQRTQITERWMDGHGFSRLLGELHQNEISVFDFMKDTKITSLEQDVVTQLRQRVIQDPPSIPVHLLLYFLCLLTLITATGEHTRELDS